jgi:hypothetical protein
MVTQITVKYKQDIFPSEVIIEYRIIYTAPNSLCSSYVVAKSLRTVLYKYLRDIEMASLEPQLRLLHVEIILWALFFIYFYNHQSRSLQVARGNKTVCRSSPSTNRGNRGKTPRDCSWHHVSFTSATVPCVIRLKTTIIAPYKRTMPCLIFSAEIPVHSNNKV